jgi:PAS domain S-box-containing protein
MGDVRQRTILLVESDAGASTLEQGRLQSLGYRVAVATGAEGAVELLRKGQCGFDLVLLDADPERGRQGLENAAPILEVAALPLVILAAGLDADLVARTEAIPHYGFVEKGSSEALLDATIRTALRLFRDAGGSGKAEYHPPARPDPGEAFRAFYHDIVETIQDLVWQIDAEGRFVYLNPAWERVLGYSLDEMLGRPFTDFQDEAYAERDRRALASILAGQAVQGFDTVYRGKDGREIHLVFNAKCHTDARGAALGARGSAYDLTARLEAEERIAVLLEEKELILKEVHHRVKNNMSTVCSLLFVQANLQEEGRARDILQDASTRVQSMSVLYDQLYRSGKGGDLSLAAYFPALLDQIVALFPERAKLRIETELEDIRIGSKKLSALGIIVNELVTNSMKYAFEGRSEGRISLSAARREGRIEVVYADDGTGLPEGTTLATSPGFGLQLVAGLVSQLDAVVSIERKGGTSFTLTFPG